MQETLFKTSSDYCEELVENSSLLNTTWLKLGKEALLITDEVDIGSIDLVGARVGSNLTRIPSTYNRDNLYCVGQKGRLFQQEHPNARILIDKGRFLIVEMDDDLLRACQKGDEPCYGLKLIGNQNIVVFEEVRRQNFRKVPNEHIQKLVSLVNRSNLESDVTQLVSWSHRFSTSKLYNQAASWAKDRLDEFGYDVELIEIPVGSDKSWNVVANKSGNSNSGQDLILVIAHLDSINSSDMPEGVAPGADDNGSGSAGLLEIARVFHKINNKHDLRFILFGGEEQGLFGSRFYLDSLSDVEKNRIIAVLNMDMIGSKHTANPTVLLEGGEISKSLIDALSEAGATYTSLEIQKSLNPFASDHVPFINAGIPAVLTIEGADSSNENIHSENDVIDFIDFYLMVEILRMNVAFIASII